MLAWVSDNTFELVPVTVGAAQNGQVAVMDAEALRGKQLVGKGAYTLLMALKNTEEEELRLF